MRKRVVVAMSGGIDSSTAAYLLLKQGFEVIGVNLKLWDTSPADDAETTASRLGIPFYTLDYEKEFEKEVIQYFSKEYRNGRTPNPCIMCNKKIKFKSLLKKAKDLEADYIATGHYVRVKYDKERRRYILKKAKDKEKDQSYFLYPLSQGLLKRSLFPLGDYTKNDVKKLAKKIGMEVGDKPASQEICFIPDDDYKSFLIKRFPNIARPGPVINKKGQVLGQHQGIAFYTIGQRRGLGISYKSPLYVLAIDKKRNTIVVGEESQIYSKRLLATNINWVSIDRTNGSLRVKAQIRYRHLPSEAIISRPGRNKVNPARKDSAPTNGFFSNGVNPVRNMDAEGNNKISNGVKVTFGKPQRSITPGQAVVFYQRDILIGGGIIEKVAQ